MITRFANIVVAGFLLISLLLLQACNRNGNPNSTEKGQQAPKPVLSGKLIYHSYNNYGDAAAMFIYDFRKNNLTKISNNWNLWSPINAHFNYNGSKIVFMAQAVKNGKWDIYLWDVGSSISPVNLTANDGCRDEDPKFSPNGSSICFKQTMPGGVGQLKIMNLSGIITNNVTNSSVECSMPYYSNDATALVYCKGAGAGSDIYMINIDGTNDRALAAIPGVHEYYPIVSGSSNFLYTKAYNASNAHDQVMLGYFNGTNPVSLPFNTADADYSDAYPCETGKLILSGTKNGGNGGYDLYIADTGNGNIWSLSNYSAVINTPLNELGACYIAN